jgi:hypothetical protein
VTGALTPCGTVDPGHARLVPVRGAYEFWGANHAGGAVRIEARPIGALLSCLLAAGAGCFAAGPVSAAHGAPPGVTLAGPVAKAPFHASPLRCIDLPISSALITPDSCWRTGPTSMVLAGSRPGSSSTGEVAVIDGQAQTLSRLTQSGPLVVRSAGTAGACIAEADGQLRGLDLATGNLGPAGSSCQPTASAPPASASAPQLGSTAQQTSGGLPPAVTPSYYEYYSYTTAGSPPYCLGGVISQCPLYQQGAATYTPSPQNLLVLDFGAPCYVPGTSTYGAQLFLGSVCVPDHTIGSLVSDWIAGYESDHSSGTTAITLAVGTSNSLNGVDLPSYQLTNTQMQTSGAAWYQQLVSQVSTSALAAPVTLWGASDMEQSSSGNWYAGTPTVDWVQGYASASPATYSCSLSQQGFLADYGDDILGGSGSADGWTASQVYQVSWGIPVACALPEIYYSGMASEWQALSQWGSQNMSTGAIAFTGVMTEAVSGSYSPAQGWQQLESATTQSPPIAGLTEIGASLQGQPPQVTGVEPSSGQIAGGTQVTISGTNLLGATQVYFGANPATSFQAQSGVAITATVPPGSPGFVDVQVETSLGTSSAGGSDGFVYTASGAYHPLTPARIEDTRAGSGLPGSGQAPGPGGVLDVQVAGMGGVPTTGAAGVLINLTVTDTTAQGYVTAFPSGVTVPPTSAVDFRAQDTKANLVEVALGRGGQISVYNQAGTAQVVVDVEGWYDSLQPTAGAGLYNPVPPLRIADTRSGSGEPYQGSSLSAGQSLTIQVAGRGGIPSSGASAVVLNVTATDASAASYLTVYPAGEGRPLASNLNFVAGETVANQVVVPLGTGGAVTVYNAGGDVDVVVDVAGWFSDGSTNATTGSALFPMAPARAVDTRTGSGYPYSGDTLQPGQTLTVQLAGLAGLPMDGMAAAVLNVTVTDGGAPGYLTVWPDSSPPPLTSELNWAAGQTTENLAVAAVSSQGELSFYNGSSGTVQLVIDASGWFAAG